MKARATDKKPPVREMGRVVAPRSVSATISPDADRILEQLTREKSTNKAEVVRLALTSYFENLGYASYFEQEDVDGERFTPRIHIRSVKQAQFHAKCLIQAFEETLNYDPKRHHNEPPPALRIEEPEYLKQIAELVKELRELNQHLSNFAKDHKTGSRDTGLLKKNLNVFLKKYAATLGYGAGMMTLGAVASLLYQLGVGEAVFDHISKKFPIR